MRIVIAGGHGQIAMRLEKLLTERGDSAVGIIRNPKQAERAKGAADADLASRAGLDWTILRPGRLTDEPGTGLVRLAMQTGRGSVPRDDVAAVLLALLDTPAGGMTLELVAGDTPVDEAVRAVASV